MAYAASRDLKQTTPRTLFGSAGAKVWIAGGVMALAVGYMIVLGLQNNTEYFLTVGELEARGPTAQNQVVRVSGTLVPGTMARAVDATGVQFAIADGVDATGSNALPVVYQGAQVPDIVGDDIQIVADGQINAQGTFEATTLLAKCPSHLENAPPEEHEYGPTAQT